MFQLLGILTHVLQHLRLTTAGWPRYHRNDEFREGCARAEARERRWYPNQSERSDVEEAWPT